MLKSSLLAEGFKALVNLADSLGSSVFSHDFTSSGAILILLGEGLVQFLKSFKYFLAEIFRLQFIKFLFVEFANMLGDLLFRSKEVNSKFIEWAESCHSSYRSDYETIVATMPV